MQHVYLMFNKSYTVLWRVKQEVKIWTAHIWIHRNCQLFFSDSSIFFFTDEDEYDKYTETRWDSDSLMSFVSVPSPRVKLCFHH